MQQVLKGGFIMVNVNEMTLDLTKELAFSKEELKELENARTKKLYLMKIVLRQHRNEH